MLTGIDHLVIAVHDPDAAADALEREMGLAFTAAAATSTPARSTGLRSSATAMWS